MMLRKFMEGLFFGAGFGISFVLVWYLAFYLVYPLFIESELEQAVTEQLAGRAGIAPADVAAFPESGPPFHELGLDEQIKRSSVIALAEYEPAPDGRVKAVIREFLKREPGTVIYYAIGEEYEPSGYYPEENTRYGDGVVIFFRGSPASMMMSVSYDNGRIRGLGGLPVALLREKCADPDA